jgi:hypothetical protein
VGEELSFEIVERSPQDNILGDDANICRVYNEKVDLATQFSIVMALLAGERRAKTRVSLPVDLVEILEPNR